MGDLTSKQRSRMKPATFALPKERAYPIPDLAHAKAALSRAAANATPAEQAKIKRAVYEKFPSLKPDKK